MARWPRSEASGPRPPRWCSRPWAPPSRRPASAEIRGVRCGLLSRGRRGARLGRGRRGGAASAARAGRCPTRPATPR
ncbi:hypothetical protein B7486_65880 [cyanobacterium TDX16]|nr:hypothetical protein B7486_65880 [cyanobacterium TDX16]